jgi:uncharacterized membrane protein
MAAFAYILLARSLIRYNGPASKLARAVGEDQKSKISLGLYALAIPLAFVRPWMAMALYVLNAMIWLIPDRRIESLI